MTKVDPFEPVPELDQEVIGMEKYAAIVKIENAGHIARVFSEDGEDFAMTMDFNDSRLNLEVVQGKVAGVHRG